MTLRMIRVSIDVFAAIWKAQLPGENSETTILARLLGTTTCSPSRRKVKGTISDEGSQSKVDWSKVEA